MTIVQEFLKSGLIEDYCLGLASSQDTQQLLEFCQLYPEVKQHLEKTQESLVSFADLHKKRAPEYSRQIIKNSILENLKLDNATFCGEEDLMLTEFIGISRHTDLSKMEALVDRFKAPEDYENIYTKPLFVNEEKELTLMWAKQFIPEEIHQDLRESFFILEGTVDCYIEKEVFSMGRGDFMAIPLDKEHRVLITSPNPAKAIVSRVLI